MRGQDDGSGGAVRRPRPSGDASGPDRDSGRHAALASPVRRDALEFLRAAPGPLTAAALADHLRLHVTTARFHLDQLERVGLVASARTHSGRRGRPATTYRVVEIDRVALRDQMIDALALAVAAGGSSPEENARSAGRRWAAGLAVPSGDVRSVLTRVGGQLGFDPEPTHGGVELRGCPFRTAARHSPQVVCQVHLGLLQGVAARADDGEQVTIGLVPFVEPEVCQVTFATTPAAPTTRPQRACP
ncbi:MAG: helix-turn-helix transcriptional regulator [Cellulomonas sp.]